MSLPVLAQAPQEGLKDSYLPAERSLGRALGKHAVRQQREQPWADEAGGLWRRCAPVLAGPLQPAVSVTGGLLMGHVASNPASRAALTSGPVVSPGEAGGEAGWLW